jgi:flavin-dependent dehydrogenase
VLAVSVSTLSGQAADTIRESARDIPVAYQVDVVVVGGTSGAVSAAVAAAKHEASVFLAAPLPYLGEDLTGTLQLWLEPDEVPVTELSQRVYRDVQLAAPDPDRLEYTYQTDAPSDSKHKDTSPPGRLRDGLWSSASGESVQYNGDVTIVADLQKPQEIRKVRLRAYRRATGGTAGSAFDVARMTVSVSDDQQTWSQLAVVANTEAPAEQDAPITIEFSGHATGRFLRVLVEKPATMQRLLLGELEIVGPERVHDDLPLATSPPPRPMHVKRTLDEALLQAGVQYLYGCYATDVLRDARGELCGIVMANRTGRQAVLAKTIIDATSRATVARLAGAKFRTPDVTAPRIFKRVVIGGQPQERDGVATRVVRRAYESSAPIIEYTLSLPLADDSYAACMRADQQARTVTYHPDQLFTSDVLWEESIDCIASRQGLVDVAADPRELPIETMQPEGIERLYVLGPAMDVPTTAARKFRRPVQLMQLGERLGEAVAVAAQRQAAIEGPRLTGIPCDKPLVEGDVRESLAALRAAPQQSTIPQEARGLPVWGNYDVVVIGGGTGGAPAGIGAARQGAKTLVVEYLHGLGGVGTQGAISSYYWGNRVGFTATVLAGATKWDIEPKMEWYRQQLLEAGAEIWFGAIGCGAFVQGNRVLGAVVATPLGRGVVLAKTVIDATGNSDIAAPAGAETLYTDASEFGMQGTGLPGRRLRGSYNNTDFTIVDETDIVDIWQTLVYSKDKYPEAFDHGRLIDTRERRRILGDYTITLADQITERTYPDSLVRCWSNFDSHGYTVNPLLLLEHPEKVGIGVYVPYRAMLPQGVEGLLATGLSISAERDAVALIRMQPDIQNGGYAAGVAAAMAAQSNVPVRRVDLKQVQQHLIAVGNLPETVLTDRDSHPLPESRVAAAVESLREGKGAAIVYSHAQQALPLLATAYAHASAADKTTYAKALAILGNDAGYETLEADVRQYATWDDGWNFRAMGQFGSALSPLDTLVVALGHTRRPEAVPAIVEKLKLLNADSEFSHHRAAGLALELIGDRAATAPLTELLNKPGMMGHVQLDIKAAKEREVPGGVNAVDTRRASIRELALARALYRCGDPDGLGEKILRAYTRDLRGHLARHAQAVLDQGPPATTKPN